jgi:hypothetical protein
MCKTRRNGEAIFGHCLRVSKACSNFDEKIVALLHDIIEDHICTFRDLDCLHLPRQIKIAIYAITRKKGESYREYIKRVRKNRIARNVKIQDNRDNLPDASPKHKIRYRDAILFLSHV